MITTVGSGVDFERAEDDIDIDEEYGNQEYGSSDEDGSDSDEGGFYQPTLIAKQSKSKSKKKKKK